MFSVAFEQQQSHLIAPCEPGVINCKRSVSGLLPACFLVMDDFKISKLDRFRFDFLKKI